MESRGARGLSPERVITILARHGTKVDLKQAGLILSFMEKLVTVAVNDFFRQTKSVTAK